LLLGYFVMDYFAIPSTPSKALADGAAAPAAGRDSGTPAAGLGVSFGELLHKAGLRIEAGLNALTEHASLVRVRDNVEPVEYRDQSPARYEERPERADAGARDLYQHDDRREAPSPERRDDYARDRAGEHRDQRPDQRSDDHAAPTERRTEQAPAREDAPGDGAHTAETGDNRGEAKADDGSAKKTDSGRDRDGAKTDKTRRTGDGIADGAAAQQAAAAKQTAELVIAGLLAGLHVKGQSDQADDQAQERAAVQHRSAHAVDGLANALAALAKQTGAPQAKPNTHTSNNGPTLANPEGEAEADSKTAATNAGDVKVQQAASLADKIGAAQRLAVHVNVTSESQTLVSKPAASLTPTAVAADGNAGANGGATNHGTNGGGNAALALAGQSQAAAAAQGQVQANSSAGGPTASFQQALTEAKAVSAPSAATAASSAAHGGDAGAQPGAMATGLSQHAPQVQHAQAAAQTHAPRLAQFKAQVLDQVSVHVTKALNDGTDKITIQLKPEHLGRIEVAMEVAADGRMHAVITADNKETLQLLQRDARDLARALQDAGLQANAGNLDFNLREQQGDRHPAPEQNPGGRPALEGASGTDAYEAAPTALYGGGIRADGRIDIRA
jgi:flagellar hook-length control protein FliK